MILAKRNLFGIWHVFMVRAGVQLYSHTWWLKQTTTQQAEANDRATLTPSQVRQLCPWLTAPAGHPTITQLMT